MTYIFFPSLFLLSSRVFPTSLFPSLFDHECMTNFYYKLVSKNCMKSCSSQNYSKCSHSFEFTFGIVTQKILYKNDSYLFFHIFQTNRMPHTHKFCSVYAVESTRTLKLSLQHSRRLFKIMKVPKIILYYTHNEVKT